MSQTVAALIPAAVDYERTLVLAIEVSNKSWVLAAQVPGLPQTKAKRTIDSEAEALLAAVSGYPAAADRTMANQPQPPPPARAAGEPSGPRYRVGCNSSRAPKSAAIARLTNFAMTCCEALDTAASASAKELLFMAFEEAPENQACHKCQR